MKQTTLDSGFDVSIDCDFVGQYKSFGHLKWLVNNLNLDLDGFDKLLFDKKLKQYV